MADIFLSYAREDRPLVGKLVEALEAAGFSVWWDALIESGSEYTRDTDSELRCARAVVVAWSEHSVGSVWVRDEAAVGRDQGKLFPISLDGSDAPLGFRQFQVADFSKWRGEASHETSELAAALRKRLGAASAQTTVAPGPPKASPKAVLRLTPGMIAGGAAVVVALLALLYFGASREKTPAITRDEIEIAPFTAVPDEPQRRAHAVEYAAAFSSRLTETGVKNKVAAQTPSAGGSEFVLAGQLTGGDKETLSVRIDDRASGATVWSYRGEPTEGAAWEANLGAFSLKCALQRRSPKTTVDMLARYVAACADFLEGDFENLYAAAKDIHEAAPDDANAIGFFAVASASLGWGAARSNAEYKRYVNDSKILAEKALAIDADNPDALFALVFQYDDRDFAALEAAIKRAHAADVKTWGNGRYANLLTAVGRIDEAIDFGQRALNDRRTTRSMTVARQLAAAGDSYQSRAIYDELRAFDPEAATDHETVTAVLYGDIADAERRLAARKATDVDTRCLRLVVAARRGELYDAEKFGAACGGAGDWSARYYAIAGDLDAAYREIESVLASPKRSFALQLFWPEMKNFLRDPRFFPLADRLGLVDYWLDTDEWPDFCREPDLPFDCKARAQEARNARAGKD